MWHYSYRQLKSLIIAVITIFAVVAAASYSFAFTAETYGNFGDVSVISVEGDYDVPTLDSDVRESRQAISRKFYESHIDKYDFLIIFSNFDFQMPSSVENGEQYFAQGLFHGVSNSEHGIGREIFDNTPFYGSEGRLKGYIDMGYLGKKATDPLDPDFTETMTTLSHEMLHQWGAYVQFEDQSGSVSDALIGRHDAHWSYLLDSKGSVQYGNNWRNNGDGTFTALPGRKYYSPLDLYLMGLIDKAEVPPMLLIENPAISPEKLPDSGITIDGTALSLNIEDIIAVEGERVPSSAHSQKTFTVAAILITRPGTYDESELYQVRSVMNNWVMWFSALTDGRASVVPDASTIVDIPENPGVRPLPYEPRDLPPEIQDAVNWLIENQEDNGSWADSQFSVYRDTAQSLIALTPFAEGEQNVIKGLDWLNNESTTATDTLVGKIVACMESGRNCDDLINELLFRQNADGGWGATENYISNPLDTACAVVALATAGISDVQVIGPAIQCLRSQQNIDLGWGSGKDLSDIITTVTVMSAFMYYQDSYELSELIQSGLNWLYDRQNIDGGFGNSPSTLYDTAMAMILLTRIDSSSDTVENALDYIFSCQSANGSWYESPYQTALAVNSVFETLHKPDLVIETGDITLSPSVITMLPADVSISAVVSNRGFTDVPEVTVALYKGVIAPENQISRQIISLAGQSTATINFTDTVTEGEIYYYILVDEQDQVNEASETNNQVMKILYSETTYDFEVLDSDVSVLPEMTDIMQSVTISAIIRDKGASDVFSVPIKFYVDGVEIAATSVDLAAGSEVTKEVVWKTDKSGALNVSVTADPDDTFAGELSETNNTGTAALIVNPATKPNLAVSHENLMVTPTSPLQGGDANISVLVANNGFGDVNNIDVLFYIGDSVQGAIIGSTVIQALAPGESLPAGIEWTGIDVSGEKLISVAVSTRENIEEITFDDNSAFKTINILSLPDLSVTATTVVAKPAIVSEGDPVNISVTVQNKGQQEAVNVDVVLIESGNPIDTGIIDSIPGNSQETLTFSYDTTGKSGSHEIQVTIDPENTISESNETNNISSCGFAIQNGDLWLTEKYISPNGDNVKDFTQFFFTFKDPQTVFVEILNDEDEVVRTFSGPVFENCTGGEITWDGLNDQEMIVPDGQYRIRVVSENGLVFAETSVIVDNNRSLLSEAVGTPYFFNKNITCSIPGIFHDDNNYGDGDGIWDLEWFSDESGMLVFVNGSSASDEYPGGLYTISPDGADINRLVPWEWDSWWYGTAYDLSQDEESIVFVYDSDQGEQVWTVDRYGQNLFHVTESLYEIPGYIEKISYAPDNSKIAYYDDGMYMEGIYVINADGSGHTKLAEIDLYVVNFSWSPDSSKIAYIDYKPNWMARICVADIHGNVKQYNEFINIVEAKWVSPDKLIIVDHVDGSQPEIFDVWLIDVTGNNDPVKISGNIYSQTYWDAFYITYWNNINTDCYPTNNITVIPDSNIFAFIDNSGENFVLRLCDDQGNCEILHESPKVNQVFGCDYGQFCWYSYVSMNDLRLSPNGKKLAFVDYASDPLPGEILDERGDDPCSYQVNFVVIDLMTGEKRAYPFDEFNACRELHSYHIYTQDNESWTEKGVLHYGEDSVEKRMDLFESFSAPDNTYKLRIEQTGEESAEIEWIKLHIDGQDYYPVNVINLETGEDVVEQINSGTIDAHYKHFEATWEDIPATAQSVCEFYMCANEINLFYENGTLHWVGNNALTARDTINWMSSSTIVLDIDSGKIDYVSTGEYFFCDVMTGSPQGNYVIYQSDYCEDGGDIWALSSMMNLTAVLETRRTDSAIVLEGTATDLNFDRYVLEYADVETPGTWLLISPPSETSVVNDRLAEWVPPGEGSYYVRLTVYDKAGNQVTRRKQVTWGAGTVISSLYKTDVMFSGDEIIFTGNGEMFSPYTDSEKQAIALHYRVMEPVNLEFTVVNEFDEQIITFDQAYVSIPAGGTMDYIIWDGKDDNGNIVPDGTHTIKILDYQFFVEVDRTPPVVLIDLSEIFPVNGDGDPALGSGAGFRVELTGSVQDQNLKEWNIEYGVGVNPEQWVEYTSGSDVIEEPITFLSGDISFAAGKTFKIMAIDTAGNISSQVTGQLEQKFIINQWEVPASVWADIGSGNIVVTDNIEPWFNLGLTRDENDNIIPFEYIPDPYLVSGIQTIRGIETIDLQITRAVVQYCGPDMLWLDLEEFTDVTSGIFELSFDTSSIDMETVYVFRIKVEDAAGNIHFSNPMPIRPMLAIDVNRLCEVVYNQMIHEDLEELQFQSSLVTNIINGEYQWQEYEVYSADVGYVIENGVNQTMPLPLIEQHQQYVLRIIGTGESGNQYASGGFQYPPECTEPNQSKFSIDIIYNNQGCNMLCSAVSIVPDYGDGGPPSDFSNLTYFLLNSKNEMVQTLGSSADAQQIFDFEIDAIAPGAWQVKAVLEAASETKTVSKYLIIDDVLPQAEITYPSAFEKICPIPSFNGNGDSVYIINVEGIVKDNLGVGGYELYYGNGENPASWFLVKDPEAQALQGDSSSQGQIGAWNVTDLASGEYSLKLVVSDAYGNTQCHVVSGFYIDRGLEWHVSDVDKKLFSPNGDGIRDDVRFNYTLSEDSTIGADILTGDTIVKSLLTPELLPAGIYTMIWDDVGLADGLYDISIFAEDACGYAPDQKLITDIEVDNTLPEVIILSPKDFDPLGIIVEIFGSADDRNFANYQLIAVSIANPDQVVTVRESSQPVTDGMLGTWNTFGLSGSWQLSLTAKDKVGNENGTSVTVALGDRELMIRDLSVSQVLISPNNDGILDQTEITYELNPDIMENYDVVIEIRSSANEIEKTYAISSIPGGLHSYTWNGSSDIAQGDIVPDDVYQVLLKASLTSSPTVVHTESITVEVDTLAPDVAFTKPDENGYINDVLEIIGSVSDRNLNTCQIECTGRSGSVFSYSGDQNRVDHRFAYLEDLSDGEYEMAVVANDTAGNKFEKQIYFIVDHTPPEVDLTSPTGNSYFGFNNTRIDIAATIEEQNIESWSLSYGAGQNPSAFIDLVTGTTVPVEMLRYDWLVGPTDGIADGIYTIRLSAVDKAGWSGDFKVTVVVDNTPPVIDVISPETGACVKSFEIKGTVFDSNIKSYMVDLSEGDCSAASKWSTITSGKSIVENDVIAYLNELPEDGDFCFKITAVDQLDNTTSLVRQISIDSQPPSAPVLSGELMNLSEGHLSWTQNTEPDFTGFYLYRNGLRINADQLSSTEYIDTGLGEGTIVYTITAVDTAGWESAPSNPVELRVDMTGPVARISEPHDGSILDDLTEIKGTAYSQDDFKEYRIYWGEGEAPAGWSMIRKSPAPVTFGILAQNIVPLIDGAVYAIKLEAEDLSGNISSHIVGFQVDSKAPSAPVLISAVPNGTNVDIAWQDNIETDLAGYLLYRNNQLVNADGGFLENITPYLISQTVYQDTSLADGTYRYYLCAVDSVGNISTISNIITVQIDAHPPHMVITSPENGYRFADTVEITAETMDLDIAEVIFQYKNAADIEWSTLEIDRTKNPWQAGFEPETLGLQYGEYDLRAVATDTNGNVDSAPEMIRVVFTDLTPPEIPTGLLFSVNGGDVYLSWQPNSEDDLAGYNVYQMSGSTVIRISETVLPDTTYTVTDLDDGEYLMSITAIDSFGNESNLSESVSALIYTPSIWVPEVPLSQVTEPEIFIAGSAVMDAKVEIFINGVIVYTVNADDSGIYGEEIILSTGENELAVRATDADGNVSKLSATVVVIYNEPPSTPTGLTAVVAGSDCTLAWNPVSGDDIAGYNLYRGGEVMSSTAMVISGTTSASVNSEIAHLAFDQSSATGWSSSSRDIIEDVWWQIVFSEYEQITSLEIEWADRAIGSDFAVQLWDGRSWWTYLSVTRNQSTINRIGFEPDFPVDRIRIASIVPSNRMYVQINEVRIEKSGGGLITGTSYNDTGLSDGVYEYQVSAVDTYGFESPLSPIVYAEVGDVIPPLPPENLTAIVSEMDILLNWSPNAETDLAGYNVYKNTPEGWVCLNSVILPVVEFSDTVMANGEYEYRVTAIDAIGNKGQPSEAVTAIVNSQFPPSPEITNVITAPEGDAVYICWEFPGWTVAGFNLYRSLEPDGAYTITNNMLWEQSCYLDEDVVADHYYYYKISAIDAYGFEGAYSDPMPVLSENRIPMMTPVIIEPTRTGNPLITTDPSVDISGAATPGTSVELYQNGEYKGAVIAEESFSPWQFNIELDYRTRIEEIAVSPDGRQAAYMQYDRYVSPANYTLELIDLGSGETRIVADDIESFKWSPNGGYIAYTANRLVNGMTIRQIFIYDTSGDTHSILNQQSMTSQWAPAWSSDGNRVVFIEESEIGVTDVWVKNLKNRALTQITQEAALTPVLDAPQFSPDDNYITYIYPNGVTGMLYIVNTAGGEIVIAETDLYYSDVSGAWYKWSADGRRIVYLKSVSYRENVFVYNIETRTSGQVTSSNTDVTGFDWYYDGLRLIYTTGSYYNAEIRITPSDIPNCDKSLLQPIYGLEYLFTSSAGGVWYAEWQNPDFILYRWFKGRFDYSGIPLHGGENNFFALSVDSKTGTSSPWSGSITIIKDQGTIPDLELTEEDIYIYPAAPVSGEIISGSITVKNTSAVAVANAELRINVINDQGVSEPIAFTMLSPIDPFSTLQQAFTWDSTGLSGLYAIEAVVDPSGLIFELSEENNRVERKVLIAEAAGLSMTTSLDGNTYPAESDVRIEIRLCYSGLEESGWLTIEITDEQDNLVETILNKYLNMPYGFDQAFMMSWNTKGTYAGQYAVKVTFLDDHGERIKENKEQFTILPDLAVLAELTTDRLQYGPEEDVNMDVRIENLSRNSYLGSVQGTLRIMDTGGIEIFVAEKDLGSLFPGATASWAESWHTGIRQPGAYTAEVEIFYGNELVSTCSNQFEIYSMAEVSGTMALSSGVIIPGESINIEYSILNNGNVVIDTLPISIVLIDSSNMSTELIDESLITNIAVSETRTGSADFSSSGYGIKQYTLLLKAEIDAQLITLASKSLLINDAIAPSVIILSPEDSGIYYSKFNLSVEAEDKHSIVDCVEYRMDDGQWNQLPPTDPSGGLYSVRFTPSGDSEGEHIFSFRAADTNGNISTSTFATVQVVPKTEISADIGIDTYGMNADVSVDIGLQNTGWAKTIIIETNIENSDVDETVAVLDSVSASIAVDGSFQVIQTWNTGAKPPGNYLVRTVVKYNDQVLDEAVVPFTVTDGTPPEVTIISPEEGAVYDAPFELSVSAVDNASGIEKVEYRFGTGQWQEILPAAAGSDEYTVTFTPTEADEGVRTISYRAFDVAGNESAYVSVAITIESFREFKVLTGSITADPDPVLQGMDESYSYSISNSMAAEVEDVIIRVCIVNSDTGLIVKTLEHTVTVAGESIYIANFIDSVDFDAGAYQAILSVALDAPVAERQLAVDEFEVDARPMVTVKKTVSDDIRLLVWLNDNCRLEIDDDPESVNGKDVVYVWKDCIRNDLLERILQTNVSDYTIVTQQAEFEKELRNPFYTDILILGNQNQVEDYTCYELVEKINSGTGIMSAKWISHVFSLKYNDVFGVKAAGNLSGDPIVEIVESPITEIGLLGPVGPSVRVETLGDEVIVAGWIKGDKKKDEPSPAIILNTFGSGKSVYFAFDLGMMMDDDNFEIISDLVAGALAYIKGEQAQVSVYPWQVVPVAVSVESTIPDYNYRIIENFAEGLFFYDQETSQWIVNCPLAFDVDVVAGEETTQWFYYLTPDEAGIYPTETQTGILFNGEYVNLNTSVLDIPVEADRDGLIDAVLTDLDVLEIKNKDLEHAMLAMQALEMVKERPVSAKADISSNISDIISALQEVIRIDSVDISDIRSGLDQLLRIEQGRYYLYGVSVQ